MNKKLIKQIKAELETSKISLKNLKAAKKSSKKGSQQRVYFTEAVQVAEKKAMDLESFLDDLMAE